MCACDTGGIASVGGAIDPINFGCVCVCVCVFVCL